MMTQQTHVTWRTLKHTTSATLCCPSYTPILDLVSALIAKSHSWGKCIRTSGDGTQLRVCLCNWNEYPIYL